MSEWGITGANKEYGQPRMEHRVVSDGFRIFAKQPTRIPVRQVGRLYKEKKNKRLQWNWS
ncbi:hypothetical protein HOLleu_38024 [Holothuria leucospilota]|uniref:Uncharacterized protein n=1 Tax=Holothuria leucospilota TaxID=206669 RepID=A0A9Q0YIU3_HOLLE|nr:hypothetical protein HOLleu_38024 [Holothuria leucospilota]